MALSAGVLLDTHSWLWLESDRLHAKAEVLSELSEAASQDRLFLVSFSLCEVANALTRGRINLALPFREWLDRSLSRPGPRLLELTTEIAIKIADLPSTFHGDPGDRILAATAMSLNMTICTHDKALLRFAKAGLFRAIKVDEAKQLHVP